MRWNDSLEGYTVIGPNGNSIFLPATGMRESDGSMCDVGSYGFYWVADSFGTDNVWSITFTSDFFCVFDNLRANGMSVRLVQKQ